MKYIQLNKRQIPIDASECIYVISDTDKILRPLPSDCIHNKPGVYIFWGWDDKPIRIGKAVKLRNRIQSYVNSLLLTSPEGLIETTQYVSCIYAKNERAAYKLELALIEYHQPKFNKVGIHGGKRGALALY